MGRAEKALLLFLALSAASVGWLAWDSRATGEQPAAPESSASPRSNAGEARSLAATSTPSIASPHVSATLVASALPAPVRDLAEIRRRLSSDARNTYVNDMLLRSDSTLSRWPDRYASPVKVWIQPSSSLPDWSSEYAAMARNAFGAWQSIFVPVRFDFVSDSAAAEVTLTWRGQFDGLLVGATRRYRDQHGWLGRAEIQIAMRTSGGDRIPPRHLSAVMIHEVGHALGVDHSPDPADIMAERTGAVFEPTGRDVATLALIYTVPPGSVR